MMSLRDCSCTATQSANAGAFTLPPGAKIRSMQVANNRLIMDVEEDGVDRVMIFNTDDGHLIGHTLLWNAIRAAGCA